MNGLSDVLRRRAEFPVPAPTTEDWPKTDGPERRVARGVKSVSSSFWTRTNGAFWIRIQAHGDLTFNIRSIELKWDDKKLKYDMITRWGEYE